MYVLLTVGSQTSFFYSDKFIFENDQPRFDIDNLVVMENESAGDSIPRRDDNSGYSWFVKVFSICYDFLCFSSPCQIVKPIIL